METNVQPNPTEAQPKDEGDIIGEVILGTVDPSTLTEEQFLASQDLLFHGAAQEFTYSPNGEYDRANTGGDGTADYGMGFYTTDNRSQAENFSQVRGMRKYKSLEPLVYPLLPFNAKMLDVRDKTSPDYVGVLPRSFVEQWLQFLDEYLLDENTFASLGGKRESIPPKPMTGMERWNNFLRERVMGQPKKLPPMSLRERIKMSVREDSLDRLQKVLDEGKPVLIRSDGRLSGIFHWMGNGLISEAFHNFMRSQGYDGMIYREGGEGEDGEDLTGYVFYNPEVVDTYEGWQKRASQNS